MDFNTTYAISRLKMWDPQTFTYWSLYFNEIFRNNIPAIIFVFVLSLAISFGIHYACRNQKIKTKVEKVKETVMGPSRPRFRKRDKVMFYGRKMLRKVRMLSSQAIGRNRLKKRQLMVRFAKSGISRLLRLKRDQPLTLQVKEPSQAFLEEDLSTFADQRFPPEVMYMLKSIRVFGIFEKPLFLELCKHLESIRLQAGSLIFNIGDPDDSIYVVQSGKVSVFITEYDGTELVLKIVKAGENVASLLSFMDVLTGHTAPYKSVSARVLEDCEVLKLRIEIFRNLLSRYPESLVRVSQIIMVRLQRITFMALHKYLGLTTQLVKSTPTRRYATVSPTKLSPTKVSFRRTSQPEFFGHPSSEPHPSSHKASVSSTDDDAQNQSHPLPAYSRQQSSHTEASSKTEPITIPSSSSSTLKHKISTSLEEASEALNLEDTGEVSSTTEGPSHLWMKQRSRKRPSFYLPDENQRGINEDEWKRMAFEGFRNILGVTDEEMEPEKVEVKELPAGVCLIHEDSLEDTKLFYVLCGGLTISLQSADKKEDSTLFVAHVGELMGALAVLTGEPSLFTVKTRYPSRIGILDKSSVYEILRKKPEAVLNLAHSVIQRLSPFVRQIDFAMDWMNVEAGRALYRQEDPSDSCYILLSGRLRSVVNRNDGKKELVGEYGRGDIVGIVEVLIQAPRSTTIMAVRDSELAKLPEGLLNAIKIKYPEVVTRLVHLLGRRILGNLQKGVTLSDSTMVTADIRPSTSNFSTVAILGVTDDVPLSAFSLELHHALTAIGPTMRLTSDFIKKNLGPSALVSANEYRLCSWLGQQEDQHKVVLYQCDTTFTTWTQRCIRQADCILIIALADQEPSVGKVESQLEHLAIRTQKELILLHKEEGPQPRNTVQWLNMRSWCCSHHHIRCPKRMFARKTHFKIMETYNKIFDKTPNIHSDFSRLARFLTGTTIGLVLGGGGARGAAHVGMIRAIVEAGIPIDYVGGVSIGAFMGALWCQEKDLTTFIQKAREWSIKMTSYWSQITDLTYPVTAMFTGAAFNRLIHDVFGDRQIEDLWLPYFTLTTDITSSSARVHTHGSLWRYIRSSMSLSGYMPPLCDPTDGHLLLDGGYVNNLPADVMKEMGVDTIIAVDVGSQDATDLTNYGDTLSGWWLLWKRWNPWSTPIKVPSLPEIQSRLAYVSCVRQLELVKQSDYCTYVRPPIDKYKTLQFGLFDEIMEVGYNHGKNLFHTMKRGHKSLQSFLHHEKDKHQHKVCDLRHASFTDLAEMVCKIQPPRRSSHLSDISEEELAGYTSEPELILESDHDEEGFPSKTSRKMSSLSDVEYAAEEEEEEDEL